MSKLRVLLCLCVVAAAVAPATAGDKGASPGGAEALPEGARLRLASGGIAVGGPVGAVVLSSDGKYLAVAGTDAIDLFERSTGKRLVQIAGNGLAQPRRLAFAPDGKALAYLGMQKVVLVEVPTGAVLQELDIPEPNFKRGRGLTFSADGKLVALGMDHAGPTKKARAFVWTVVGSKLLGDFEVAQNAGCGTALSPDGKLLATWGRHVVRMVDEDEKPAQQVQLWDVATGKERRRLTIDAPNVQINAVAFAADGKTLAVNSGPTAFHVFDTASGQELRRFAGAGKTVVTRLQWSDDGKLLVAARFDGTIHVWRADSGKPVAIPAGRKARGLSFAFVPAGRILAAGLVGQTVVCWDVLAGPAGGSPGHQDQVIALAFSPDGQTLTSISSDGKALCWDPASGQLRRQVVLLDEANRRAIGTATVRPDNLALAADGRFAAISSIFTGIGVRLWDLRTGQVLRDFKSGNKSRAPGLAFAPGSDRLAAAGTMMLINLWEPLTGKDAGTLPYAMPDTMPSNNPPRVRISPDGKTLALVLTLIDPDTGVTMARILLLDVASGKERFALQAPVIAALGAIITVDVAFTPDGKLLAVPGPSQTLLLVRADSGKEWKRFDTPGGFAAVSALAFSPDGRTLAVANNSTLDVWELASAKRRVAFKGQQGIIHCLAFSPDGRTLASGSADTSVVLWDVTGIHGMVPVALSAQELTAAWAVLARPDGVGVFDAQRRLTASPAQTVAFLQEHLPPAKPAAVEPKQIERWVADLDSETFETRDTAFRALEKLGGPTGPALRQARAGKISLEMRRRIDNLLEKLERGTLSAEELQAVRAVEVLERIATPPARTLIAALAEGAATAPRTQEARRALRRMKP